MLKVEATEFFTLRKFDELQNIVRKNPENNRAGELYEGDTFECTEEMANYLMGGNKFKRVVIKPVLVEEKAEEKIEEKVEEIKKPKKSKKKKDK